MFKDFVFLYFCAVKPFWKYPVCFNNLFLINFISPIGKKGQKAGQKKNTRRERRKEKRCKRG